MKRSAVSAVLILVLSLALWMLFFVRRMPLDAPATLVVVGIVALVVVGTRWLLAAYRQRARAGAAKEDR